MQPGLQNRSHNEYIVLIAILLLAFVNGLLYIVIVPPWQHYDEPNHFEYVWLLAERGGFPKPGDYDSGMRRDVAQSMVEHGFFDQACRRLYGQPLLVRVADTQVLARRALDRGNQSYGGGDLRLAALRSRYHLPRYPAHNALSDALAAAELFLALTARHGARHKVPLKQVTVRIRG